jgi:D-tyrosyl-tRNA(Tyr) deacylase
MWCVTGALNAVLDRTYVFLVSQFTLLASTKKGSKPDFHGAMGGDQAKELYQIFFSKVQQGYDASKVKDGIFQAMMVGSSVVIFTFSNNSSGSSFGQ